jgi:hypothetical protein
MSARAARPRALAALAVALSCVVALVACAGGPSPVSAMALVVRSVTTAASTGPEITVPVYIHSIVDDGHPALTERHAQALVAYLNDAHAGQLNSASTVTPFRFVLKGRAEVHNHEWYDPDLDLSRQLAIRKSLHVGDVRTLDIVVPSHAQAAGVSFSSFPGQAAGDPKADGVSLGESVLRTSVDAFGPTLVHEVGHWLGLLHTFSTCAADDQGDQVTDTPASERVEPGQGDDLDTCPDLPGNDPTHNFMTYYPTGPYEFTPGQVARMAQQWATYRA